MPAKTSKTRSTSRNAVIYARVSADKAHGRSLDEQVDECRKVAEREHWTVTKVIREDVSASRFGKKPRTGFTQLLTALKPGDVLLVWEASRAARDLATYVQLRDLCADLDVLFSYSGRTYDLSKGDDRFATAIDAVLAERYAEDVRQRALRAQRANLAEGKPHGRQAYGYRIVRDEKTGRTVGREPDPDEAPIVRELFDRIMAGDSTYKLAHDMNERGVPVPGRAAQTWTPQNISRMVRRPVYAGLRTHKGEVSGTGTWEPLIDEDRWYAAQSMLNAPQRRTNHGLNQPRHLLTGIAVCSVCGDPVVRIKSGKHGAYRCGRGKHVHRSIPVVDEVVERVLLLTLSDPRVQERIRKATDTLDDVMRARELAVKLRDDLDTFYEQAAEGKLTAEGLARVESRLLKRIEDADSQAQAASSHPILARAVGMDPRKMWDALSLLERRELIRSAVTVAILPIGPGLRKAPPEDGLEIRWATA